MSLHDVSTTLSCPKFIELREKACLYQFQTRQIAVSRLAPLFVPKDNFRGEQALIIEGKKHLNAIAQSLDLVGLIKSENPPTVLEHQGQLYGVDGYHRTHTYANHPDFAQSVIDVQVIPIEDAALFEVCRQFLGGYLNGTNKPAMSNSKVTIEHFLSKHYELGEAVLKRELALMGAKDTDVNKIYRKVAEAVAAGEINKKTGGKVAMINYTDSEGRAIAARIKSQNNSNGYLVGQGNIDQAEHFFGSWLFLKFIKSWQKDKTVKGKFFVVPRAMSSRDHDAVILDLQAMLESLGAIKKNITICSYPIDKRGIAHA